MGEEGGKGGCNTEKGKWKYLNTLGQKTNVNSNGMLWEYYRRKGQIYAKKKNTVSVGWCLHWLTNKLTRPL